MDARLSQVSKGRIEFVGHDLLVLGVEKADDEAVAGQRQGIDAPASVGGEPEPLHQFGQTEGPLVDPKRPPAGSDPADPNSTPLTGGVAVAPGTGGERLLGGAASRLSAAPKPVRESSTRIEFELTRPTAVTLRLFDAQGRLVRTLVDGTRNGPVEVEWDLRNESGQRMPSGVYFYRLADGRFFETRRLTILK